MCVLFFSPCLIRVSVVKSIIPSRRAIRQITVSRNSHDRSASASTPSGFVGSRITIRINGTTVNECYDVFPSGGKILLQNEVNDVDFRNLQIRPLKTSN